MSFLRRLFHRHPAPSSQDEPLVHWDGSLSVGNALIDNEHRAIIGLLNVLYADWRAGTHHLDMGRTLTLLERTLDTHFANEEEVMARHHYPLLPDHQAAHHTLLSDLSTLHQAIDQGGNSDELEARLTFFVRKVVMDHVMTWDMDAKDHLKE